MGDEKKYKTEYENGKSTTEEVGYNRKNVNSIKRLIMIVFVLVCALPILFCLYLMIRMNSVERKLDRLTEQFSYKQESTDEAVSLAEAPEDLLKLEQEAYDDLGKSTVTQNPTLMNDGKDDTSIGDNESDISEEALEKAVPLNGKKVYLTFDDGPSTYTDDILDILDRYNVKATFFVVHNPDESLWHTYKRIAEEGHTLAMHSYTHEYGKVYESLDSFEEDVNKIHDFLLEQTGVDCRFYRFPGGSSNSVSNVPMQDMMEFLYNKGYTYFDWNSLSGDAVDASLSAYQLNSTIMGYVDANEGDSVVLMHDLQNVHTTVDALPDLIETLQKEGYEICAIDETTRPVQHVQFQGADE